MIFNRIVMVFHVYYICEIISNVKYALGNNKFCFYTLDFITNMWSFYHITVPEYVRPNAFQMEKISNLMYALKSIPKRWIGTR